MDRAVIVVAVRLIVVRLVLHQDHLLLLVALHIADHQAHHRVRLVQAILVHQTLVLAQVVVIVRQVARHPLQEARLIAQAEDLLQAVLPVAEVAVAAEVVAVDKI